MLAWARTFGGLGGFLVFVFLGAGVYLLQEAFSDPLRAEAVGPITGAFILATATIVLYFVFSPWPRYRRREVSGRTASRVPKLRPTVAALVEMPAAPMALPVPASTKENGEVLPLPA